MTSHDRPTEPFDAAAHGSSGDAESEDAEATQRLDPDATQRMERAPLPGDEPEREEARPPPADAAPAPPPPQPPAAPPPRAPTVRVGPPPARAPAQPRNLPPRRFATLAAFANALIPPGGLISYSAADVGVAERVDAGAEWLEPRVRRRLEGLLRLWEWMPILSRTPRRFSKLSSASAAMFLERSVRSRNPIRRQAFTFLKILCLNQFASTPAVEQAVGFTYACVTSEPPRDGPPLEVIAYPDVTRSHTEECDVVVVGSGAGGAVVAKELAEVGLSVIVLEEGAYFTRADFAGPPWERYQRFYRGNGTTVALGVPTIPLPLGKAVGGSTLVNSGTCFRTPGRVLERWGSEWGIEGIDPEGMRPFFERVERILHVKPVPEELLGPNARVFRRGVDALGLHGAPILRAIEGCRGCGVCAFGCPSDAKQSTHISYLPRAQRHGATIFGRCRAERILVEDGRARGVVASLTDERGEPKATLTVRAKIVVLAAGAIHTPALLQSNALANRSGEVGRNLRIHPAAGVGAWFEEEIYGWRGTLQPFFVDDWHASHDIMIEVTSSIPSIGAGTFPGTGLFTKELLGQYKNLASAGLFVSDTSAGRVRRLGRGEPVVTYRLNKADTRKLVRGLVHVAEIFFAAGARAVFTGLPGLGLITHPAELEKVKEEAVRPGALKLTAFHPVGTARMGADPARTVVDPWGECHEVPGLFVADASVLPGCPTVNPQITIMSFATRTAEHIVRERSTYV